MTAGLRRAEITGDDGIGGRRPGPVVVFDLIEFSLVIIPYAFLEFRPEATKVKLKGAQDWLTTHARQLIAGVAVFAGLYMAISGLVRLLLPVRSATPPSKPVRLRPAPMKHPPPRGSCSVISHQTARHRAAQAGCAEPLVRRVDALTD